MKKTILFIITKSETGGAQKFVYEQISTLSSTNKWDFLLATNIKGWLTQSLENIIEDKHMLIDSRIEGLFAVGYLLNLIRFINKNKPDLIVANSANGGVYGRIASFLTQTKVIYVSHGWSSIYNGGSLKFILNFIEKLLSYITTSILCVSEKDKAKAIEILKIAPSKLIVIPNSILPIDSSVHKHIAADIVTVCRLAPPKRIDILIEAMSLLPDYCLHIVGDGPQLSALQKIVNDRNLKNIQFRGYTPNFREFSQYKVFCLISDSEGMPMSAIEAMSCGLPLVLSNVGGCSEVIQNNGLLVANVAYRIADCIKEVMGKHQKFSNASKNLFEAKFNLRNTIHIFESYYAGIINSDR